MRSACAVPYRHLWPLRLYTIFTYYLINHAIFGGPGVGGEFFLPKTCVLIFSIHLPQKFLILPRIQRDTITNVHKSTCSARYSWQILTKQQSSLQIFEKSSNIKFNENRTSGSRAVSCGRAGGGGGGGGRTNMTTLIVVFRNFANAPNEFHTSNIFLGPTHNKPYFRITQYVTLRSCQISR